MLTFPAATELVFRVDFISPLGTSLPAADGSITYEVPGVLTSTSFVFSNGSAPTGATISLTSGQNPAPVAPKLFDTRRLIVKMTSGGIPYRFERNFRVVTLPQLGFGPDEVRSFIGLSVEELPDQDIDIAGVYLPLKTTAFDTALASGTAAELAANEVLLFSTVINVIPSCQLRARTLMEDGGLKTEKMKRLNFDALMVEARRRLEAAKQSMAPSVELPDSYFFALTTQTDAITGA
jgi:hypothetical protein